MPNWTELSAEDLDDYKVAELMTALREEALRDGQSDPFDQLLADAAADIRRKIAANPRNQLDRATLKIPKGLKSLGCRRIIAAMKGRLEIALSEDERRQIDRDDADLNRIADGKDPVDTPDNPAPTPDVVPAISSAAELITSTRRRFTGDSLRRL